MSNIFIKTAEREMIPKLEKMGITLNKKTTNEIGFRYKDIELSICFERMLEIYVVISSLKLAQSVYLSEVLSDYLNDEEKGIYYLSDRFPIDLCMRKLLEVITIKVIPLIADGRIIGAIKTVISIRKEGLRKYNEGLIEIEAKKAFKEKRYGDVISLYTNITELNDVQRKRLDISTKKLCTMV